jgi:hypothetical protein
LQENSELKETVSNFLPYLLEMIFIIYILDTMKDLEIEKLQTSNKEVKLQVSCYICLPLNLVNWTIVVERLSRSKHSINKRLVSGTK